MKIAVTPIEDFIKVDMTKNEIVEDLNMLYSIINDTCGVNSADYRCYVTPMRELIIDFLIQTNKFLPEDLIERISEDSTMLLHGIEDIKLYLYGEDNNEVTLEEVVEPRSGVIIDLEDYVSEEIISVHSIAIDDNIESFPFYKSLIADIARIKGFSLSTLSLLLSQISSNNDEGTEETQKIKLQHKAVIHNTLDVFLEDIKDSQNYISFKEQSIELSFLLNGNNTGNQIDENEAIDELSQKEKLSLLEYFLGAESTPFLQKDIIYKNRLINIKFYLLLALTYYAFGMLRKMEMTQEIRKNKKRNIERIGKVVSGKQRTITSKHIIEYLKVQNNTFNPNSISQLDTDELKELVEIIEKRPEYYSHKIKEASVIMFGEGHRPLNRYLQIMGFKSVGNSTKLGV